MKLNIIISVLDSHEVLRRQLQHFNNIGIPNEAEVIIMDDNSDPPLSVDSTIGFIHYNLRIIPTNDPRPWTTGCSKNKAVKHANGEYIFVTDIDHIISKKALDCALSFDGDKLTFPRRWGILTEDGDVLQEKEVLFEYGLTKVRYLKNGLKAGHHPNTFVMKKSIYTDLLGGYDESLCGRYGGSDVDINKRYGKLHYAGKVKRSVRGPHIYVFPDPRRDVKKIFHNLKRKKK
jgi:hypothetical protein